MPFIPPLSRLMLVALLALAAPALADPPANLDERVHEVLAAHGVPGMAVTIDIGEEKDVHPRNKQDVGKRLALLALGGTYGRDVIPCGPVFKMAEIEDGRVRLHFDHIGEGLVAKDGPLKQFAIAGDDRKFVWADAEIDSGMVIVHSSAVPRPAYVRYAWADNPAGANLFNSAGLPAAPFRTDP